MGRTITPKEPPLKYIFDGVAPPVEAANGTWMEAESFAYPKGGFTRRAFVIMPDGEKRVVKCSIPDTYFSIPAKATINGKLAKGFLMIDEAKGIYFTPEKTDDTDTTHN